MTVLVVVDFKRLTCRRFDGRRETHGFLFESEAKMTPEVIGLMRAFPETVGIVERPAASGGATWMTS